MWIVWYREKGSMFDNFAGQYTDEKTANDVMLHLIDQGYIARIVHF